MAAVWEQHAGLCAAQQGCCSREQSWEQQVRLAEGQEDLHVMRTRAVIRSAGAGLGKLGTPRPSPHAGSHPSLSFCRSGSVPVT